MPIAATARVAAQQRRLLRNSYPSSPNSKANSPRTRRLLCGRTRHRPIARPGNTDISPSNPRAEPENASSSSSFQLFPAARQTRIAIPSTLLSVDAKDVLNAPSLYTLLDASLPLGSVTGVILGSKDGATGELYTATTALKEYVAKQSLPPNRQPIILVSDRSDVAEAAGVDGVVLSMDGLPIVVAKNQLGEGKVVGKVVQSSEEAVRAAFEGAGLVMIDFGSARDLDGEREDGLVEKARTGQVSGSSVPVVGFLGEEDQHRGTVSGLDGVVVRFREDLAADELAELREGLGTGLTSGGGEDVDSATPTSMPETVSNTSSNAQYNASSNAQSNASAAAPDAIADVLSSERERLITRQKTFLQDLIDFISAATPSLEEVSLLKDSLKQLDELFLVVIVGEFNSGKSAVVNAMLGNSVVPEGILPTTNEITVIKHAETGDERVEQDVDGLFVRYTAAELLKEINIVDTPGTNVILERQQRLTEEFIPRADLVLFVISADRPFTDSEVKFLKYVRQWGKKVVFVVNKVDLLSSSSDIDEVVDFVEKNATRLLGVEGAKAIPVSAKLATQAKIESRKALNDESSNVLTSDERSYLANLDAWKASRFGNLETHIRDFLLGDVGRVTSAETGTAGVTASEGMDSSSARSGSPPSESLKLQTPLFVADALINAAKTQLETELSVLRRDEESVRMVSSQLDAFRDEMNKEAKVQKAEIIQQTDRMVDMISNVVDQVLTVSNWQTLLPYYTSKEEGLGKASTALSTQDVSKDAMSRVNGIVEEHREWLRVNCQRVSDNYREFVAERMEVYGESVQEQAGAASNANGADDVRGDERRPPSTSTTAAAATSTVTIDMRTIAAILETEIQTAVKSSINTFASAILFSLLLTSILPNTLEDLLAIGIGAAFAYASVLNIPVRRMEAKKKVKDEVQRLVKAVHDDMNAEEQVQMEACIASVGDSVKPLDSLLRIEIARLSEDIQTLNGRFERQLDALRNEI